MSIVQVFNRERRARVEFIKRNRDHMLAYKDAILAFALFYPTVEFLGVAAIALILWVGGVRIFAGTLTLGVLVAFMQFAQRFFRPIQDLSEKFNILQSAMAASERIFKLLDEPAPAVSPADAMRLEAPRGEILLDGSDIRKINIQDLRRMFGIVLQDPFLFTGTIESNIRLGSPGIDRKIVEQACEEIGLAAFL